MTEGRREDQDSVWRNARDQVDLRHRQPVALHDGHLYAQPREVAIWPFRTGFGPPPEAKRAPESLRNDIVPDVLSLTTLVVAGQDRVLAHAQGRAEGRNTLKQCRRGLPRP